MDKNDGEDTDSLILYCTSFQSQGHHELANKVKESLRKRVDLWSKAFPPSVMDLKELGRKSAAADLKDIAAYVAAIVKPFSEAMWLPSMDSTHSQSSVQSTEESGGGCVLQRLFLCILGMRHRNDDLNDVAESAIAVQEAQPPKKKKDYLALTCTEMPVLDGSMQQLVDNTFKCWGKARDSLPLSVPDALTVKSVVHVEKQKLYSQFTGRRADIGEVLHLCPTKPFEMRMPCITEDINEYWLWHGTTPEAAKKIINRGFDLSRAGSGGGSLFGKGICFAESSLKADFYAKAADERGWYVLLLCRVVLGRVRYCDDPDPDTDELENSCALGRAFHAVVGDREKIAGSFREVVVFDERQIYPEYMVWYTRS